MKHMGLLTVGVLHIFKKQQLLVALLVFSFLGCSAPVDSYFQEPVSGIEFVRIPKGNFLMGTQHSVANSSAKSIKITKGFWLGKTEVTQQQWQKIMGMAEPHPEKPSPFRNQHPNYPVVSVSYHDVALYLKTLNVTSEDYYFRLPTEAEWEYACRAGSTGPFAFGTKLSDKTANFNASQNSAFSERGTYLDRPQPVASYKANQWGLYDMHGNVWEWVADWYAPYSWDTIKDPKAASSGQEKVIRGGSWYFSARHALSSYRGKHAPELWGFSIGFRVVCEKKK